MQIKAPDLRDFVDGRYSQFKELEKDLCYGYAKGGKKVTFARYTGQEEAEEREKIQNDPPDILLTNHVMLEVILTRQNPLDQQVIRAAQGLEFLVLDELHKDGTLTLRQHYRQAAPVPCRFRPDGQAIPEGLAGWFLAGSFRFCPSCGVEHNVCGSEVRKLCGTSPKRRCWWPRIASQKGSTCNAASMRWCTTTSAGTRPAPNSGRAAWIVLPNPSRW